MGFSLGDDEGDDLAVAHEINVTPFIDVILVLLIIFMVAAPLSTVELPVDLPHAGAAPQPRSEPPTTVTIAADLGLSLGETPVARADLAATLDAAPNAEGKTRRIHLRADRSVAYGEVMAVLDLLRAAGYLKVALVARETPR